MSKLGKTYSLKISNNEIRLSVGLIQGTGGKRGVVKGMTRKSKSALMGFINAVKFDTALFVTLTYRYNMQDDKRAYRDLRLLVKTLENRLGGACVVWKKELQERGAIHYHLFIIQPPGGYTGDVIRDEWMRVTEQEGDLAARTYGTKTEKVDVLKNEDAGVIVTYLAKYAAKSGAETNGKAWGILGRKYADDTRKSYSLPLANISAACDELLSLGGQSFELTPTGVQYRLYLGHIGRSGESVGDDRADTFACRYSAKVIE